MEFHAGVCGLAGSIVGGAAIPRAGVAMVASSSNCVNGASSSSAGAIVWVSAIDGAIGSATGAMSCVSGAPDAVSAAFGAPAGTTRVAAGVVGRVSREVTPAIRPEKAAAMAPTPAAES